MGNLMVVGLNSVEAVRILEEIEFRQGKVGQIDSEAVW